MMHELFKVNLFALFVLLGGFTLNYLGVETSMTAQIFLYALTTLLLSLAIWVKYVNKELLNFYVLFGVLVKFMAVLIFLMLVSLSKVEIGVFFIFYFIYLVVYSVGMYRVIN